MNKIVVPYKFSLFLLVVFMGVAMVSILISCIFLVLGIAGYAHIIPEFPYIMSGLFVFVAGALISFFVFLFFFFTFDDREDKKKKEHLTQRAQHLNMSPKREAFCDSWFVWFIIAGMAFIAAAIAPFESYPFWKNPNTILALVLTGIGVVALRGKINKS